MKSEPRNIFNGVEAMRANSISVVIPARNEEMTIHAVVKAAVQHDSVAEVIVVDNGSLDETANRAREAGARVLHCADIGLGRAMKVGIAQASQRFILRSDADIDNWQSRWIDLLMPPAPHCLSRGIYQSPYNQLPMSNYVVRPYLNLFRPEWASVPIPTTGTYLLDKDDFDWPTLPNNWAIDVAILFEALARHPQLVRNIEIGTLSDRRREVPHYVQMATDLTEYLIQYFLVAAPPSSAL